MSLVKRPVRPAEVEGFLESIEHRVARQSELIGPNPTAEQRLSDARAAIRARRWSDAETALTEAALSLDSDLPERALSEWPRGLVGYVPEGDAGVAPDRSEEPVANRLLLVQHLLAFRRSQGWSVEALIPRLQQAELAYQRGERSRARRITDEVHAELERARTVEPRSHPE